MNFHRKLTAILVVSLSTLTIAHAQNHPQDNPRKGAPVPEQSIVDKKSQNAIHTLLSEVQNAWAKGDLNRYGHAFSEDAIFVPFNGRRLNGRMAIQDFHAHPFSTEFRGSKLEIDIVDIRPLTKGVFLVSTNGGPLRAGEAHGTPETQTYVIQDFSGRWSIVFFQNTPVLPPRDH
jgi:uncharacterized protein (TIGR02246 family)